MAEYIEREAAKKEFTLNFGSVSHAVIANRLLDSIPAADVAPVVRCKDCKYDNDCFIQESFKVVNVENPFCCLGNRKRGDG